MSAIILDDDIVHYEVLGRGRPIVFLHGWVGSWRYWIPSMQAASVSFRAYALDMWGFGDSAKNTSRYLLSQQLNLLKSFLNKLGIGKVALVGHGLGAIVALLFSEENPQYVDRVMAVAVPLDLNQINPRMIQNSPEALANWLLGSTPDSEAARNEAPKADQDAIYHSLRHLDKANIAELPSRLSLPCLLVHGQNDQAISVVGNDQAAQLPAHFHFLRFDNAGHFPMLDMPNKFNRLMTDFMALSGGESPRKLDLKEEWKRRVR
ncbi:MAG: alpha/beta hydrolase [Anaerolineales bacterium]|nr:alpha/beta hydrolase [Chloroflexota bacterium]MBL6982893.1 alpha/beta hydrolase [Anaerolineales bacterium]